MKKEIGILCAGFLAAILLLCACGADDAADQLADGIQESTGTIQESTNVSQESTDTIQQSADAPQESAGTVQESTEAAQESTGATQKKDEYVGEWFDTVSQRCYAEISSEDGIHYSIDINWASGASDNTHWSFSGTYDESEGKIHYSGSRIEEYYPDEGDVQETYAYTDGEGYLWIGDDGMLYWDDLTERQGEGLVFEKAEF